MTAFDFDAQEFFSAAFLFDFDAEVSFSAVDFLLKVLDFDVEESSSVTFLITILDFDALFYCFAFLVLFNMVSSPEKRLLFGPKTASILTLFLADELVEAKSK